MKPSAFFQGLALAITLFVFGGDASARYLQPEPYLARSPITYFEIEPLAGPSGRPQPSLPKGLTYVEMAAMAGQVVAAYTYAGANPIANTDSTGLHHICSQKEVNEGFGQWHGGHLWCPDKNELLEQNCAFVCFQQSEACNSTNFTTQTGLLHATSAADCIAQIKRMQVPGSTCKGQFTGGSGGGN